MIDRAQIKVMAKERGWSVRDLLALANQNDPFYIGSATDISNAKWFANVWKKGGFLHGAHLRRTHYWCTTQSGLLLPNGLPFENTENTWVFLCQASKVARYLDLVPIEAISDHKNPESRIYATYGKAPISFDVELPQLNDPDINIYGFNSCDFQGYHIEIFVEKSTMDDVLDPLCSRLNVNLTTGEGEFSIPRCLELVERIREADRPSRLFYISDFDPAGQAMPHSVARKVEWMMAKLNVRVEFRLEHLVLTLEQVKTYDLPRTPIKNTEKRGAAFEQRHGAGAVELDALEALRPGELARIVTDAVRPYRNAAVDDDVFEKREGLRQAVKEKADAILAEYREGVEALDEMRWKLLMLKLDPEELVQYTPHKAVADVEDDHKTWLLDSRRGYLEQIRFYKAHSNGGSAV